MRVTAVIQISIKTAKKNTTDHLFEPEKSLGINMFGVPYQTTK